jgi:hypothetical protein
MYYSWSSVHSNTRHSCCVAQNSVSISQCLLLCQFHGLMVVCGSIHIVILESMKWLQIKQVRLFAQIPVGVEAVTLLQWTRMPKQKPLKSKFGKRISWYQKYRCPLAYSRFILWIGEHVFTIVICINWS